MRSPEQPYYCRFMYSTQGQKRTVLAYLIFLKYPRFVLARLKVLEGGQLYFLLPKEFGRKTKENKWSCGGSLVFGEC